MDEEINKLKSVLKSLVVSSPTQVDVRTLMKDYRNMIGTQLPISKYGYKDPVTFLKERCTDCFLVSTLCIYHMFIYTFISLFHYIYIY